MKYFRNLWKLFSTLTLFIFLGGYTHVVAQSHIGAFGDVISYKTGELSLSEADVTIPGKRGMDVIISRSYSSQIFEPKQIDNLFSNSKEYDFGTLKDSSLFSHLGLGWRIEFPCLKLKDGNPHIVNTSGIYEALFYNTDSLTLLDFPSTGVDSLYMLKSYNLSLFTNFGVDNSIPDTMLAIGGNKYVFGHLVDSVKYMTKQFNQFGDSITIIYHDSTQFIKRIVSPIGRDIKFIYGSNDSLLNYDSIPTYSHKLYQLEYKNYLDSTMYVKYHYDNDEYLTSVIYPMGDSISYDYTDTITINQKIDWWEPEVDSFDYDDDCDTTLSVQILYQITTPRNASVKFNYRFVEYPIISSKTESASERYVDYPDGLYSFNGYIGVYERIEENDTLFIHNELSYTTLSDYSFVKQIGAMRTIEHPSGTKDELFYYVDLYRQFDSSLHYLSLATAANICGYSPGGLIQQVTISDNDTNCTGYYYPVNDFEIIGKAIDTLQIDTFFVEEEPGVVSDTIIDTILFDPYIYTTNRSGVIYGVGYINDAYGYPDSYEIVEVPKRRYSSSYRVVDMHTVGLPVYSITAQYDSGFYAESHSYNINPWDSSFIFGDQTLDSSAIYYSPALYSTDTLSPIDSLSFAKDSVISYGYVPKLNKAVLYKVKHTIQNNKYPYAYYEEFTYDTNTYQISESKMYYEFDSTNVFVTKYIYDSLTHNLTYEISPVGDTTTYVYDTLYNDFVIATLNSRVSDTLNKTDYYYPFNKVKTTTDINGATTYYYYDLYGRDSVTKAPLESDYSVKYFYEPDSFWNATQVKIDSGLEMYTKNYTDKNFMNVKSLIKIDDSTSVIDTSVYNSFGELTKSARSVYNSFDTTNTVWTYYKYLEDHTKYKTILPNGDSVYSARIDELQVEKYNPYGAKTVKIFDYDDNLLEMYFINSDTVKTTYEYGKFNSLLKITYPDSSAREFEYDDYGRPVKLVQQDIGSIRTWYDRWGNIRFYRYNSDTTYRYLKYDDLFRVIEEGLIVNPDTTYVDSSLYPHDSISEIIVSYKYDSYQSGNLEDTANGLHYSKGKLTEITRYSSETAYSWIGYYYDERGRVGVKTETIPNIATKKKIRFEYYANDQLKKVIYPDSTYTEYTLNSAGQTVGISDLIGLDSVQYEAWGAIKSIQYQNGVRTKNSFDNLSRLTQTLNYNSNFDFFNRKYVYENGFLKEEYDLDSLGDTTTYGLIRSYGYDNLYRLDSAFMKDPNGSAPNRTAYYEYDLNNNLDLRYITGIDSLTYIRFDSSNCDSILNFGADSSYFFTKDDRGRIIQIERSPTISAWSKKTISYNNRNQVERVVTEKEFYAAGDKPDTVVNLYNGLNQKVYQLHIYRIQDENNPFLWNRVTYEVYYVWSNGKISLQYNNQTSTPDVYVYGLGKMLARKHYNSGVWSYNYYITDGQGTVHSFVRANGVPDDWRIEYYPYGGVYSLNGTNKTDRYFIGKEEDQTGNLDFSPRYFSLSTGRFMAPDPILSGASPYAYANGNPIMMYDPTGLQVAPDPWYNGWINSEMQRLQLESKEAVEGYWKSKIESDKKFAIERMRRSIARANETRLVEAKYIHYTDAFKSGAIDWDELEPYQKVNIITDKGHYGLNINVNQESVDGFNFLWKDDKGVARWYFRNNENGNVKVVDNQYYEEFKTTITISGSTEQGDFSIKVAGVGGVESLETVLRGRTVTGVFGFIIGMLAQKTADMMPPGEKRGYMRMISGAGYGVSSLSNCSITVITGIAAFGDVEPSTRVVLSILAVATGGLAVIDFINSYDQIKKGMKDFE